MEQYQVNDHVTLCTRNSDIISGTILNIFTDESLTLFKIKLDEKYNNGWFYIANLQMLIRKEVIYELPYEKKQ